MKLPPHMAVKLIAYVRSDSADAGSHISMGGCVDTDVIKTLAKHLDRFSQVACDTLNAALEVTDSRPMTPAEVQTYLAEQQADEHAAGRISESERIT